MFDWLKLRGEPEAAVVREAAVVDVGSNSVRLVIYEIQGGAIFPIYNDRVAAGLGRSLAQTGRLDPDGVAAARDALARFKLVLDARGVRARGAAATAAVREARDRSEFVRLAETTLGTPLRILSGPEEGAHSALGVLAAEPRAGGLVADLGGTSMEIAALPDPREDRSAPVGAQDVRGVTTLLGPYALGPLDRSDLRGMRKRIDKILDETQAPAEAGELHVVGGAWRNLARVDMAERAHPIRVLHGYEMTGVDLLDTISFVLKAPPEVLARTPGISKRRLPSLPLTALVLERLVKRTGADRIQISAFGLREGLLAAAMEPWERAGDPLLSGAEAVARRAGADPALGRTLAQWLTPAAELIGAPFGGERDGVVFGAAARLADLCGRQHPDHRAELVYPQALNAPIVGLDHVERAFLALVLHHRYAGRREPADAEAPAALLSKGRRAAAMRLGLAMRFGCEVSGRAAPLLRAAPIRVEDGRIRCTPDPDKQALLSEQAKKRLAQFAAAAECEVAA